MPKTVLKALLFAFLLAAVLTGCGPSRERTYSNPGQLHAQEVGEIKLPNDP